MKRSSDDIEATTKGEEPRLEIDDSASACFWWLKVQKAILSLQWRKAGHEVWVKKGSSASFYCKVPSLVSRMSSFYKSLVEQGPTTQQPTKVCFSFSTGGTQHSIPVLVLSRMFATQCSHDPLVADYVDIILFDAQFSKASEENYPR